MDAMLRVLVGLQFEELCTYIALDRLHINMSGKHPNKIEKGHRIESPRELCVSLIVLDYLAVRSLPKRDIRRLKPLVYSPIFTLIFIAAWKLIQLVTSQGCFGRAKMAANFALNQPTSNG